MFNQIINSSNLLNFILPIFLADEDMRSDDEMYDKVPEKLIIHHYCKIPVCFYSFPDKKFCEIPISEHLIMELKSYTMPPLKIWKKVNFLLIRTMTNMIT